MPETTLTPICVVSGSGQKFGSSTTNAREWAPRRAWEVARIRFVTWLFECFATPINRTRRKNVSCPNASNRRTGQWDVDVPFQTDPQNGMTSEGYMSRDSTASCFEFAYSHTVAENLPMSGGEKMTFVGFAHRDNIATSRSRSARACSTASGVGYRPRKHAAGADLHRARLRPPRRRLHHRHVSPRRRREHGLATNPGPEFGEWANTPKPRRLRCTLMTSRPPLASKSVA